LKRLAPVDRKYRDANHRARILSRDTTPPDDTRQFTPSKVQRLPVLKKAL